MYSDESGIQVFSIQMFTVALSISVKDLNTQSCEISHIQFKPLACSFFKSNGKDKRALQKAVVKHRSNNTERLSQIGEIRAKEHFYI